MRIAWWSPLPPQRSGIADYSAELLGEISSKLEVIAVVDDRVTRGVRLPGVECVGATSYLCGAAGHCDLDVYQMGNHPWFHAYMHGQVLDRPGIVVLHDPSLVDFYLTLCGGADSPLYHEELRRNGYEVKGALASSTTGCQLEPDRLSLLMCRRIVEASTVTLVHSPWARDELIRRHPGCRVEVVPSPGRVMQQTRRPCSSGSAVFGVFGGLAHHKRLQSVVRAFARVHADFPGARLVIAGRSDDQEVERDLRLLVRTLGVASGVKLVTDAPIEVLEREIGCCDVVVALRWPSAGETSAVVVRAMGAGKLVIVSDLPQYRHLDARYCWRVPTEPEAEQEKLVESMRAVLSDPAAIAEAGRSAQEMIESTATLTHACDRYIEVLHSCMEMGSDASGHVAGPGTRPISSGANVIGDWWATTGLAEAARRSATALFEAGAGFSVLNFAVEGVPREESRAPAWLWDRPHGRPHPVDIWYLNINELHMVPDELLRPPGDKRYAIASWYWELPRVGPEFVGQVDRVDEIWVASRFVADTFRGHTHKPVLVMPCAVEPTPSQSVSRFDFGLREESCIFLYSFDANSFFARKNPWGAINAFHKAFSPQERRSSAQLVIKTVNLDRHPRERARLSAAVAHVGGMLVEDDLPQGDMHALISLSDVYVSLHRSEGFGLGMAEAMHLGRPVIATAYSGNMDFTTHANSCLVGYRLRAIDGAENDYEEGISRIYETGQLWAEPDLEQAARWMRVMFERPTERRRIGLAGATTIRRQYSTTAAQSAMLARLEELAHA
jgi:glycosyltransferase involved in cell wall biosynthesis